MKGQNYITSSEGAIASYDWTDIAEGSGKVLFYGCADSLSGSLTYDLLTDNLYSSRIELTTPGATYDFYTPAFNLPRIIQGTAYISSCWEGDNGGTGTLRITLKLYRNGADISNISSQVETEAQTAATATAMLIKIPLTQTNIQVGDKIHMEVVATKFAPANNISIGIDPLNRDGAAIIPSTATSKTTKFMVYLPFRIDL